jgi:predicted metal-dependent hydrolase
MSDALFRDFLDFEIPVAPPDAPLAPPQVIVRRSARRKRTISAFREGQSIVVAIPARMSKRDEAALIPEMVAKVERSERKLRPSDSELLARSEKLSRELFNGLARPTSVRWSAQMAARWGSCTLDDGSIRISTRLQGMPKYVLDYVLVHELTHLLEAAHSERFYEFERRFARAERAIGFLEGWQGAQGGITDLSDI